MKKEFLNLHHAALVSALALAMGAPLAFADEAPVNVPAVEPAPVVEPVAGVEPTPVVEPVLVVEPVPGVDPVAVDEPLPVDGGEASVEPVPDDAVTMLPEEPAPADGGAVAVENGPVDDCGMMCWNAAEMPPGAVQKGGEEVDPQIMQFGVSGEVPEPTLNVSAELSGAVGVAEQLSAADMALQDRASADPLAQVTPATAVVATASGGEVKVIRDGHLR